MSSFAPFINTSLRPIFAIRGPSLPTWGEERTSRPSGRYLANALFLPTPSQKGQGNLRVRPDRAIRATCAS